MCVWVGEMVRWGGAWVWEGMGKGVERWMDAEVDGCRDG